MRPKTRCRDGRSKKLLVLLPLVVGIVAASNAEAQLDQMFGELGSAYASIEGAKACGLETQIGRDLLAYAEKRVSELEKTSKLSEAQKDLLRSKASNEAPMLVAIGACGSVLAAFQILDAQRDYLAAQQTAERGENVANENAVLQPKPTDNAKMPSETSEAPSDETQLPIAAGAYVRSQEHCEDLRRSELDLIPFELEENRRAFSTGENSCVVSSVEKISASRSKIDADCIEFGETSMLTFILDSLQNGNIRIDGEDHLYCSTTNSPPASDVSVPDLIEQWAQLNEDCRGGSGDDPETWKKCEKRSAISERLESLGYCYSGDSDAASSWRRCE